MVHQPQVDIEAVGAGPPDAVAGAADVLDQLDTATLTLLDWGHVLYGQGVVKRVLAPWKYRNKMQHYFLVSQSNSSSHPSWSFSMYLSDSHSISHAIGTQCHSVSPLLGEKIFQFELPWI